MISFKPVFFSLEDRIKYQQNSGYYIVDSFATRYKHIQNVMWITADIAKVFVLKNWELVNWDKFEGTIETKSDEKSVRFYIYTEPTIKNTIIGKALSDLEEWHNPVISFNKVVYDESDGDFSVTINDINFMWITDESVIQLADYIEKNRIKQILRNGKPLFVIKMKVGDLDKSKCSNKFLMHNFDDNKVVQVKCNSDGIIDLRGKKKEYRIIISD